MEILPTDHRTKGSKSITRLAPTGQGAWADPAILFAWGYLVALIAAEVTTILIEPRVGLVLYGTLLVLLLTQAALQSKTEFRQLLVSLTLVPFIRIASLSLPFAEFPATVRYLLGSAQLLIAASVVAYRLGLSWRGVGLNLGKPGVQAVICGSGLVIGSIEFLFLRAGLLGLEPIGEPVLLGALILACMALAEELVFRGVLQQAASMLLGSPAVVYVAILFTALHLGAGSWLALLLSFAVALFFGRAVASTESIVGVILARWLANILLLLVLPSLF